jgi:BASS family bile acid:Na+ symporter
MNFRKLCLGATPVALIVVLAGLSIGKTGVWQPAAAAAAVAFALGLGAFPATKSYQFTGWIVASVVCAMIYPNSFLYIPLPGLEEPLSLRNRWVILIIVQLVMFGMGTQMSIKDFVGVMKMPYGVLIGLGLQFTVMPLVGFALAKGLRFENPEIAAGIVLIGSCSSGLASNVMVFIAKANLALSITLVACATLVAPIMTPFWMTKLAGAMVPVTFFGAMIEIVKIVLAPVGAALLHDYLRTASATGRRIVWALGLVGAAWLLFLALGGWIWIGQLLASLPDEIRGRRLTLIGLIGFLFVSAIAGLIYHALTRKWEAIPKWMPLFSMFGIVYFTAVTTAAGRDNLLVVGWLLFVAAIVHNTAGYFFGYWLSRAFGLDKNSARTVAFEVGLQNGGMASGLAGAMGKLGTVGLAAAIFSPWMNVSGSVLANYWRRKPVD